MKLFDRMEFLLSEAWTALRRNTWMTFAAISTSAVALFLLGGIGLAYLGISRYAASLPGKFEMRVAIRDGVTPLQLTEVERKLKAVDGVSTVRLIPKQQAWKQQQVELPDVTKGLDNPLPDSFAITLTNLDKSSEVAERITTIASVVPEGVSYLAEEQRMLSQALRLLQSLGIGLGGLMLLTSGVLIYNAIRLTILARRREIRIMRLVGATWSTIVTPLLIEGVVQGAIGGVIAALLLYSSHAGIQRLIEDVSVFGRLNAFPLAQTLLGLGVAGAVYGMFCSAVAVREPRKMP